MANDRNKHVVIPGQVYRSAQMTPAQLERFVAENNIRTIVNLRGRPFNDWYPLQVQLTQRLGISQEDVTTSANRLPPTGEIRRLVDIFDHSEYPILLHCQQGADRTGLASAAYLLLHTDADYATARHQCSPRYGHLAIHTASAMDDFFEQYEDWLKAQGTTHSPANFRRWATSEYCPGSGSARLAWQKADDVVEASKPVVFTVRAYNSSRESWQFMAGTRTGVHAEYHVVGENGRVVFSGMAGFLNATVPVGSYIDLDLPVPTPPGPGHYVVFVDLSERNVSFTQYGSEPLTHDWDAR
jgi:protein tyrosine phosphatase (PTP) superfamily phosphohydrolase (DUF442 family)